MSKILVVLESPNKEAKVQDYLGDKYLVTSSKGHIRDLDPKSLSIDVEEGFAPKYYVNEDKEYVIRRLKQSYSKCTNILLATDFDREGESIAWHVAEVLNIPLNNRKRMLFTEITKKALKTATENTQDLDMNMFYAQQARRLVDRLIGYKWLSPLLWKNIQSSMKKGVSLSGGRVQSVVNKLIIDREKEILKFMSSNYFKTRGFFKELTMDLDYKFAKAEEVEDFCDLIVDAKFKVASVDSKKSSRKPSAPFITSTLQQEASNKYRMSPKQTMQYAQKLYENGLITYMRTDSVTLSQDILDIIKRKLETDYGKKYVNIKQYKNKSKNSQEAHEAIRPTNVDKFSIKATDGERLCNNCVKLYNLIWRRTVASQMSPAEVNIQTIKTKLEHEDTKQQSVANKYIFITKNESIVFDGFLRVYKPVETSDAPTDSDDDSSNSEQNQNDNKNLNHTKSKPIEKGQYLNLNKINSTEKYTRPSIGRFTEASLVKKLDELGVGRPSTYSSMVTIVQDRNYVNKKDIEGDVKKIKTYDFDFETCELEEKIDETKINGEKGKLVPTDIGNIVNTYLEKTMAKLLDYKFTVDLEQMLDDISNGTKDWTGVVQYIYDSFQPQFDKLMIDTNAEKEKYTRSLGKDPYTNREVVAYIAKYGPVVCLKADVESDINRYDTKNKSEVKDKFVSLKSTNYKLETVTLDQAVTLLKYPYELCLYKNKPVTICMGKYGLYMKHNGINYTLKGTEEPQTIEDIESYFNKLTEQESSNSNESNSGLPRKISDNISIRNGKYGPYILYKKNMDAKAIFVNIGKADPIRITEKECLALISTKFTRPTKSKTTYKKRK